MEDLLALNNCEVFNQIRSALTSYHHHKKKLNSFNYYSGNEDNIRELSQCVINVLLEHDLVKESKHPHKHPQPSPDANVDQLRGTLMYLVLNGANALGKDGENKWSPQCIHLLNQLPAPLPQVLVVSLALYCGLQKQLMEFFACGQHWLTSQYFDCFNETLPHLINDKCKALPYICGALNAVSQSLCHYPLQAGQDDAKSLLPFACRLMQRHLLDTEDRLRLLPTAGRRKRYLGEVLTQLLDIVLQLLQLLMQSSPQQLPAYFMIYSLSPVKQEQDQLATASRLRYYAEKLMDQLQSMMSQVSVDTYMSWQEMPTDKLLYHLQAYICLQSKQLLQLLKEDSPLGAHSLAGQLLNFAAGAQSFEQRLEALTLGELLGFLDDETNLVSPEQLLAGLDQLLQRSIAFGSDECLETIIKHVHLLGAKHAELIMEHLAQVKRLHQDESDMEIEECDQKELDNELYGELIKNILLPIYQACTAKEKLKLLEKRDELELLPHFQFELKDYSSRRIYFFNQIRYFVTQFPILEFLDLCYEQPTETWLSLAQLAMTHHGFARLYWQVAARCAPHARHYINYTVLQLFQDERLIQLYSVNFLLRFYEYPVLLQGMSYRQVIKYRRQRCIGRLRELSLNLQVSKLPYTAQQLRAAQENYVSACAVGLAKFTESQNYEALENIFKTLLSLEKIESRISTCSRKSLQTQSKRLTALKKSSANPQTISLVQKKVQLAKSYFSIHSKLRSWRVSNWTLISQLISSMDKLRHNFQDFQQKRIAQLDLLMDYYIRYMPQALLISPDLPNKINELVKILQHKHLWTQGHLVLLLGSRKPRQPKECAMLISQSSTLEATNLLKEAIRHRIDREVMGQLAQLVDQSGTPGALECYGFMFKCYMSAFKELLIKPAKEKDYPWIIEHLLNAPKLKMTENLLAAVDNFKILLKVDKEAILEAVKSSLNEYADN